MAHADVVALRRARDHVVVPSVRGTSAMREYRHDLEAEKLHVAAGQVAVAHAAPLSTSRNSPGNASSRIAPIASQNSLLSRRSAASNAARVALTHRRHRPSS